MYTENKSENKTYTENKSKKIGVAIFILNIVVFRQEILLGVKRIKFIKRTQFKIYVHLITGSKYIK